MRYVYLVETMHKGSKCSINGRNVKAYSSSLNAVQSYPAGTKFEWIDNSALITDPSGKELGWCSKVEVN